MRTIEGFFSDVFQTAAEFVAHGLLPWAWENKFWIAVLIPFVVIFAIAKWMWD